MYPCAYRFLVFSEARESISAYLTVSILAIKKHTYVLHSLTRVSFYRIGACVGVLRELSNRYTATCFLMNAIVKTKKKKKHPPLRVCVTTDQ